MSELYACKLQVFWIEYSVYQISACVCTCRISMCWGVPCSGGDFFLYHSLHYWETFHGKCKSSSAVALKTLQGTIKTTLIFFLIAVDKHVIAVDKHATSFSQAEIACFYFLSLVKRVATAFVESLTNVARDS